MYDLLRLLSESHILTVWSFEPDIMYMLSFARTKFHTESLCPHKTASCLFSGKLHIRIVLSADQEIMYLLLVVIATIFTCKVWASKNKLKLSDKNSFALYDAIKEIWGKLRSILNFSKIWFFPILFICIMLCDMQSRTWQTKQRWHAIIYR